jgi:hypothetical protein
MGIQRDGHSEDIGGKKGYNAESRRREKMIDEGALPVIDSDGVLAGIVLLVIVKQGGDWYGAIDESRVLLQYHSIETVTGKECEPRCCVIDKDTLESSELGRDVREG